MQAISNTLPIKNPIAGLMGLNASAMSGSTTAFIPKAPAPAPMIGGTLKFNSAGGIIPNSAAQVPTLNLQNTPFASASSAPTNSSVSGVINTNPTPQPTINSGPAIGGANSGGTMNPNYNLQTNDGTAATNTPSNTTGSVPGLFPSVLASLAAKGTTASPQYTDAYNQAQQYNTQLQQSMSNEASALKTNNLNPIPIGDQEGRAAVIQQQYLDQQKALGAGFQGASNLVAGANTQQGLQTSALNNAGGLSQPSPTAFGQTSFSPDTNSFAGGGSLPPEVMQQYAQMAATGQYSAIPSFITSNPVLNAQLNVAAKSVNPNYTPIGAQGASSVLQGIPALTSANTAADGIKNTIQNYLQANPQLNPSDLTAGNKLAQWLQSGQFGDPKYQTLGAYLSEYVSTLAPILGVGGDTTNLKTQIAQGMVNAAASGQSISEVLNNIATLATHKIQDLQSGAVGGSTGVQNASSGTGGDLYNF